MKDCDIVEGLKNLTKAANDEIWIAIIANPCIGVVTLVCLKLSSQILPNSIFNIIPCVICNMQCF